MSTANPADLFMTHRGHFRLVNKVGQHSTAQGQVNTCGSGHSVVKIHATGYQVTST